MPSKIITREITESALFRARRAKERRLEAAELLAGADEDIAIAKLQLECDVAKAHVFKAVEGSGMCGDRFEEICTNCGWIHTA